MYSNGTFLKLRNWLPVTSIVAVGVVLLLFSVGCSKDPIQSTDKSIEPASGDYFDHPGTDPNGFSLVCPGGAANFHATDVSAVLGGTVTCSDTRFELFVPPAAVNEDVEIKVDVYVEKTPCQGNVFILECGPDGLVFNTPINLSFDASAFGTSASRGTANLYWLNPFTGGWELQSKTRIMETKDGTRPVTFQIYHFSRYGISN